jgi:hypothetical protein
MPIDFLHTYLYRNSIHLYTTGIQRFVVPIEIIYLEKFLVGIMLDVEKGENRKEPEDICEHT